MGLWPFVLVIGFVLFLAWVYPDKTLKTMRSVRFNIWLFSSIAAAAAMGSFFPAGGAKEPFQALFSPFWKNVFDTLGLFNIYKAWWFWALLAVMAMDVIVCKLLRLPKLIKRRFDDQQERRRRSLKWGWGNALHTSELQSKLGVDKTASSLRRWLNREKLRYNEFSEGHTRTFFTGRHRIQRWGDFILHVSVVIVLLGGLIGAMWGFEEEVEISEGETKTLKNRPAHVTLNKFDVEYYPRTGSPSFFASDLTVEENHRLIAKDRVTVNHPLKINHLRFYQASWGQRDRFHQALIRVAGEVLTVKPGKNVNIPGTTLLIRANSMLPTFDVNEQGRAFNRGFDGKNPALQVDFLKGEKVQARIWLLENRPDLAFRVGEDERLKATPPPPFKLLKIEPVFFSGVQVAYDPGASLFWVGAVFFVIGLSMHFYLHRRHLRISVVKKGRGSHVVIDGWNSRFPQEFAPEFQRWVDEIGQELKRMS